MFISDSGSTLHMFNHLKNMNILHRVKTMVNTGNKKIMTGKLQGYWKV